MIILQLAIFGICAYVFSMFMIKDNVKDNDKPLNIKKMTEKELLENRLNNAETIETIDAVIYEMKMNEIKNNVVAQTCPDHFRNQNYERFRCVAR